MYSLYIVLYTMYMYRQHTKMYALVMYLNIFLCVVVKLNYAVIYTNKPGTKYTITGYMRSRTWSCMCNV